MKILLVEIKNENQILNYKCDISHGETIDIIKKGIRSIKTALVDDNEIPKKINDKFRISDSNSLFKCVRYERIKRDLGLKEHKMIIFAVNV